MKIHYVTPYIPTEVHFMEDSILHRHLFEDLSQWSTLFKKDTTLFSLSLCVRYAKSTK
jgi:hypothetical protein